MQISGLSANIQPEAPHPATKAGFAPIYTLALALPSLPVHKTGPLPNVSILTSQVRILSPRPLYLLLTHILTPDTHTSRHRLDPQTPVRTSLRHPPMRSEPDCPRRVLPPPRPLHGNYPLPRKHVVHIAPPRLRPIILPPLQRLCRPRHARRHIPNPDSGLVSLDA